MKYPFVILFVAVLMAVFVLVSLTRIAFVELALFMPRTNRTDPESYPSEEMS